MELSILLIFGFFNIKFSFFITKLFNFLFLILTILSLLIIVIAASIFIKFTFFIFKSFIYLFLMLL